MSPHLYPKNNPGRRVGRTEGPTFLIRKLRPREVLAGQWWPRNWGPLSWLPVQMKSHSRRAQHQPLHFLGCLGPQSDPCQSPTVPRRLGGSGLAHLGTSSDQTLTLGRFHLTPGPGVPV